MRLYGHNVTLYKSKYANNNSLAVYAANNEGVVTTITVNLNPESNDLPSDYAYIDMNNNPKITEWLRTHKIATFTGLCQYSGFCTYPLYAFDLTKLKEE